ncbi:MAG TPA: PEP-CTERM sorting domain-containing protein [Rhodocyclaceae bacterium]|nr:PEP-CTERM sorting domain-containing protein [Rhodocyclaceae bacterium]
MKRYSKRVLCACTAAFALALAAPAQATLYTFTQGGFSGGGHISGTFAGEDLDGNGQLSSFAGEVSAFQVSFSGDSIVGAFSHGFADLFGIVYDIGSGFIGDGLGGDIEGIASNYQNGVGIEYIIGTGLALPYLGSVTDQATGALSTTDALVVVEVPEPASLALVVAGLALVLRTRRRRV